MKCFILVLCLSVVAFRVAAEDPWYANDTTNRLKEVITDFRLNYESFKVERHAFVAKGRYDVEIEGQKESGEVCYIGASVSRDSRFYANSLPVTSRRDGAICQSWDQHLLSDGKLYLRGSLHSHGQLPDVVKDDEEIEKERQRVVLFNPVQMSIGFASAGPLFCSEAAIDGILTAGTLRSAKYDSNGDIVQILDLDFKNRISDHITFVYGRESNFLPISASYWKDSAKGEPILISRVETQWKELDDYHLPVKLNTCGLRPKRSDLHELSLQYAIGRALNGKVLVDPNLPDWREPLRVLFKEEWDRHGHPVRLLPP